MEFSENATFQEVCEKICSCVRKFGDKELAKEMKRAARLGYEVIQAAECLEDRMVLKYVMTCGQWTIKSWDMYLI